MRIKAVIFDLGDTLVKSGWMPEVTYQKVLASLGISRSVEDMKEAISKTDEEFEKSGYRSMYGKVSYAEYWEKWDSQVLRNLGIAEDETLAKVVHERWFDHVDCVAYPDTKETLTKLKQRKLKLGLISTGYEEDITAIFKKANLEKSFFDIIIGANTTKKEKPHPDVFKYALRKLGLKPEDRSLDNTSDFKRISNLEEIYKFID